MRPQTYTFKHAGGCDLLADVYPANAPEPAPVVVWIHGGALIGGARQQMRGVLRDLLHDAGFAQVSIDYRLAPETKLPEIAADVRDGLRWVREEGPVRFGIDPARLAVLGASAGGYLALLCGCCASSPPNAVVSYYGYGDIIGDWYSRPDPYYRAQPLVTEAVARAAVGNACLSNAEGENDRFTFYLWCRQQGQWPREIMGIDPGRDPEAFAPFCPVQNVTPHYPPTLLFHGTGDTDVPFQQSAIMARALQAAGVPHELTPYRNAPHGFDGGIRRDDLQAKELRPGADAFLKTVRFLKNWL